MSHLQSLWRRLPIDIRRPVPVNAGLLLDRVCDNRFEKKAKGRGKGESDVNSHYRKGKAGDWRYHFTDEHIGAFVEQFGDLAEVLGYEPDARWTDNASRSTPKQ